MGVDYDVNSILRVLIVALALACIAMTVTLNWARFRRGEMSFGYAIIRLGVVGVLAAMAFSTLEVLLGWHTQVRVWVLFGALIWLTVGLVWSIRDGRN